MFLVFFSFFTLKVKNEKFFYEKSEMGYFFGTKRTIWDYRDFSCS